MTTVERDLRGDLLTTIGTAIEQHPRSLQVEIGPSELGTPCTRKLGHKLARTPPARARPAAWRPTVGTAVHTWLASVFEAENESLGWERWLVETRVRVGMVDGVEVTGSADLYDLLTNTVIDWKIVGPGSLKKYRAAVNAGKCPDPGYRSQVALYGRGFNRLCDTGLPVAQVMIVFLPSAGELSDAVVWTEPYDEQVALDTLTRADGVAAALRLLSPDVVIPQLGTAEDHCGHCPFNLPGATDLAKACPGDPSMYAPEKRSMPDLLPTT